MTVKQVLPNELPYGDLHSVGDVKTLEEAEKIAEGKIGYWVESNQTLYIEEN